MKDFKSFFCSFFLITLFSSYHPLACSSSSWSGPYIGMMAGYEAGAAQITTGAISSMAISASNDLAFAGKGGEFAFGWGRAFDKQYMGVETSYSSFNSNGKATATSESILLDEKITFSSAIIKTDAFGVFLRYGYIPANEAMIYAKVGLVAGEFNLYFENDESYTPNNNYCLDFHTSIKGISVGVGTELKLTKTLLTRLEASHIQYNKKIFGLNKATPNGTANVCPHSNEIKFGIIAPLNSKT